jgi:hypothetical protein
MGIMTVNSRLSILEENQWIRGKREDRSYSPNILAHSWLSGIEEM